MAALITTTTVTRLRSSWIPSCGRVDLPEHQLLGGEPAPVLVTEGGVLGAVRMLRLELLPQQPARHPAAGQFPVHPGKIRRRHRGGERYLAPVQPPLQRRLIELGGQRPRQAGHPGPADTLLHRRAGAADGGGNLPVTELQLVLEPQNLTNLAIDNLAWATVGLPSIRKGRTVAGCLAGATPPPARPSALARHG